MGGCNMGLALLQPPNDAGFVQIVRRHLHFDAVADGEADKAFTHFARDGRQDEVVVGECDSEHGPGQDGVDNSFDFDWRFFHMVWATIGSNGWRHLTDRPDREAPEGGW
jgi:hypothetical protein